MNDGNNINAADIGRMPSQQRMTQLLSQVDFSSQLPDTGNFNDHSHNDHNHNHNHNQNIRVPDNGDNDMVLLKSKFDHAVQVYRFMHENKADAGKRLSGDMRKRKFKEILDLYNNLKLDNGPISNYLINSRDIQWASFIEDERFWKLWDEKEDIIRQDEDNRRSRRNRSRWADKQAESKDASRSRSRSRERNNRNDRNRNKSDKEQVSDIWILYYFFSFFSFFSYIY